MYRLAFATVMLIAVSTTRAENWPNWRGPHFNGTSSETNLPDAWSVTDNVAWSVDLPGCAASTPIIWDDHVFLSGVDAEKDTLQAACFDRKSGKLLWSHDVGKGISKDTRSNFASSSPVTDGKVAVFFYGNGQLAAYDFDGKELWSRNLQEDYGEFYFQWTFSSSPLLWNGTLYLQILQRDVPARRGGSVGGERRESYLLALAPTTGKTLWRSDRPSSAVAESREAFTTPTPYTYQGKTEILIAGGDVITGHDPATGKELWRWGTWNPLFVPHWRLVPSPVAGDGVILACAPKNEPIYALKAGGDGDLDDSWLAWISEDVREVTSDVPTPAFYDGDFFVLSDKQRSLMRIEPKTGKVKWMTETPGRVKYEASPLAADGKIYIVNFDGEITIVSAEDGEIIRQISMDPPTEGNFVRSTIAASQGQLFVRTTSKLYCIGK